MSDTNEIQANYNKLVNPTDYKFNFKVKKNELGEEVKRGSIELKLPVPSVDGIIAILQAGGKQLDLLQQAVAEVVVAQARSILNDNEAMTSSDFPADQCIWEFIANMPEGERRGRGIAKEVWDAFIADYIAVMPQAAGKSTESVALAAKILLNKFSAYKTNKPIIAKLREQLAIYTNSSPQAEQFVDCIKFLDEKANVLLNTDDTATLLANL